MYLNTISSIYGSKNYPKRLGRGIGSGLGKTCGRGHKGQKSRSGGKIRRGFEGGQTTLYRRLPKFGFTSHKALITKEIYLSDLKFIKESVINIKTLKLYNLINNKIKFVKIISNGDIQRKVIIQNLKVSKNACKKLELVGGIIENNL